MRISQQTKIVITAISLMFGSITIFGIPILERFYESYPILKVILAFYLFGLAIFVWRGRLR